MKNIPIKERLALLVILAMLVTNPLTGQYVMQAIDWGFAHLFQESAYVSLAGTAYLLGLGAYYYIKSNKINIPSKSAKTDKQKYLPV